MKRVNPVEEILTIIEDHELTYDEATKLLLKTLSELERNQRRQAANMVVRFNEEAC